MPEAVIIEQPSAPLTTRSGSVAPSSAGEIHVTAPTVIPGAPAKPGSAKDRMAASLRKIAKNQDGTPVTNPAPRPGTAATPTPALAPSPAPNAPAPTPTPEPPPEPTEELELGEDTTPPTPVEPPVPTSPEERKKLSPWKLVDDYKARVRNSEREIAELKKLIPNETLRKQEMEELEKIRTRNKELEDEIRFTNFAKSEEYVTKYEKPYNEAWKKAVTEVIELTVTDPETGDTRQATGQDITAIVNAPLGEAIKMARDKFGDLSASVVLNHRAAIRNLFEQQQSALDQARKGGEERDRTRHAEVQKVQQAIQTEVGKQWEHYNQAAPKDPKFGKFFAPSEGDAEGNAKLEKGYKLVDEALNLNPFDPRLNPEQRQKAVRMHSAIRHRAAAFGRMVHQLSQKDLRITELETELKQYRGSEPEPGGSAAPNPSAPQTAHASVMAALHKLAK